MRQCWPYFEFLYPLLVNKWKTFFPPAQCRLDYNYINAEFPMLKMGIELAVSLPESQFSKATLSTVVLMYGPPGLKL